MTAYELAAKFSARLCDVLTSEELDKVLELNAVETNPNICHSHDFCDPNQVMLDVFDICSIEYDPQDDKQRELIDLAWTIAKDDDFDVESIRNSDALGQ